ncbi:MAG: hypothetical protein L6E13_08665 [Firmicutes bacterium]|nr:hypothetical protein [Bacillota bacterium]
MLLTLRLLAYVQVLLGLGRFAGLITNPYVWETHVTIGFLLAVLSLFAFRPRPGVPASGLRLAARFFAIAPLALGLAMYQGLVGGKPVTMVHMALGLIAVGLIDAAAAQERRALAGGAGGSGPGAQA